MNTIRFWYNNSRPTALPQSLLPAVLAVCIASQAPGFSIYLGLLAVFGVVMAHLCCNLFDDYFDYRVKGTEFRDAMARKGFRARIAKCLYITSGQATLSQLFVACLVFGAIALLAGGIIWWFRGNFILWVTGIAVVLGISYSGAPLRLSYRGLGEIVIGIMFGPLSMTGVYYAACGHFDRSILFISVPVGLLVANIVYTHAIMDCEPDKEAGKMTFAVLLKTQRRMLVCLLLLLLGAYGCIIGGVWMGYLSAYYLFTLLTLPLAVSLFYLMVAFVRCPDRKFSPRFWMGPMGDWKRIETYHLDWFMIRWLSARNLLSFFCLILIIVGFTA
ncbi:MAG: prenyltransferase [Dysgonamonadaceae bacterium]|jgi:1,4-dihydroxy-2-naphthoate octaprenyltransferase|nr:prenyltransferase [Dysgonamonadaceae bacterium]